MRAHRIHVVTPHPTNGSTLKGISQIYYGTPNRWQDIYNANRKGVVRADGESGFIENPQMLNAGARILVP